MAWKDYKPYPNTDFGTGEFQHDSGAWVPLYNPIEAKRLMDQKAMADQAVPDAGEAPTPEEATAAGAPAPIPAPTPEPPPTLKVLPEGAKILKDNEATPELRKQSMSIVNDPKQYPMGSVVPMGDGLFGRVEQHTWTNKNGQRVPGHYRGVTLYRAGQQPTSQEAPGEANAGASYPGDVEDNTPVNKADVETSTEPSDQFDADTGEMTKAAAKETAKGKVYKYTDDEQKAIKRIIDKHPNLTEGDITKVFQGESGANINPAAEAINPKTGKADHVGIFQLDVRQAPGLGVDPNDITKMSRADQIDLYDKYLDAHKAGKDITGPDLYLLQAAPSFVGAPDSTVVYSKSSDPESAYQRNPAWHPTDGGDITVGSIKAAYERTAGASPGAATETPATASSTAPGVYPGMTPGAPNTTTKQSTTVHNGQTVQEGIPITDEERARLAQNVGEKNARLQAYMDPTIQAWNKLADESLSLAEEQKQAREAAAVLEQKKQQAADEAVAEVQKRNQEVLNDKEPPPFGGNVLAGVLAAIARGFGAAAASYAKTPNFAGQTIDAIIDGDNKRWQQQHADKLFGAKSAEKLSDDQRYALDKATAQREAAQRLYLDSKMKAMMAQVSSATAKQHLGELIDDNWTKYNQTIQDLTMLAHDHVTKTSQTANTTETVEKPAANADLGKYILGPREGVSGRAALDDAEREITNLGKTLGLELNDKTSTFKATKELPTSPITQQFSEDLVPRNPLTGTSLGPLGSALKHPVDTLFGTEAAEKRKRLFTQLNTAISKSVYAESGKQINTTELERMVERFNGLSPQDQVNSLTMMLQTLKNKKAELGAAYPGAAATYSDRIKQTLLQPDSGLMPKPDEEIQ